MPVSSFCAKLLITAAALVGAVGGDTAFATFPGENGKIAFASWTDYDVYAINPDGTGLTNLSNTPSSAEREDSPVWSPDGAKVGYLKVFSGRFWTVNPDGSGAAEGPPVGQYPQWSPDGQQIAYRSFGSSPNACCPQDIFLMSSSGSNPTRLTASECPVPQAADEPPCDQIHTFTWSPDGQRIAFIKTHWFVDLQDPNGPYVSTDHVQVVDVSVPGSETDLANVPASFRWIDWSPDGQRLLLSHTPADATFGSIASYRLDGTGAILVGPGFRAKWSPDGRRVVYQSVGQEIQADIYVRNADGTGSPSLVYAGPSSDNSPDWQPVLRGYARPRGARPLHASLAIAYRSCTSANREHGPPLVAPSCGPAVQSSDYLTAGTGDANGQTPKFTGYVRYDPIPGNESTPPDEADVRFEAVLKDVRSKADLSDYTGELDVRVSARITDRDNTPHPAGSGPGTTNDTPISFTVPCTATLDATVGSSCSISTTVEALLPNAVKEGRRSIWQLGQVQVNDGGPDGDAETAAGNTVFATEGLFTP